MFIKQIFNNILILTVSTGSQNNCLKLNNINYFDPHLMESYNIEDIIIINKNTYFWDVYLFIKCIKNATTMGNLKKIYIIIFNYLYKTALQ